MAAWHFYEFTALFLPSTSTDIFNKYKIHFSKRVRKNINSNNTRENVNIDSIKEQAYDSAVQHSISVCLQIVIFQLDQAMEKLTQTQARVADENQVPHRRLSRRD